MTPTRDRGAALLMVLATMLVLTSIVGVAATQAFAANKVARHSADWNQALSAAEAGVDDYLARLNANDNYWLTSPDCSNVAMRTKNVTRCGWGANTATGWAQVPGAPRSFFHYASDASSTLNNGTVRLVSTGKVGAIQRTVSTVLRRGGFGEFLYYTVYETIDPANEPVYGLNNTTAQTRCAHYYWEPLSPTSRPRDTSYCADINFISGDVIDGPLHTNDAMMISGSPQFKGTASTSWPQCKPVNGVPQPASKCYRPNGSLAPRFDRGIAYRAEIELPTSIGDLKKQVDPAQVTAPGCLYTGPTRIRFNDNPSGGVGTMTVWSKWSKKPLNPGCGNYTASWPQTVPVPTNNVIVVQDVPATQTTPSTGSCAAGSIGDGLPQSGDHNQTFRAADCRYGTLYVEGTVKGRVTLSAENNVYVTGDLTYAGGRTGTDIVGLIAQNSVEIYHPVKATCTRTSGGRCVQYSYANMDLPGSSDPLTNVTVHAAILTLQHSFTVQQYNVGARLGSINLFGSFAQRFRGPVGTSSNGTISTGYLKNYSYDTRLRYAPPPFFLDPVRASWGVKAYGEVPAGT